MLRDLESSDEKLNKIADKLNKCRGLLLELSDGEVFLEKTETSAMAALPRVRQIEEDLRKAQLDPRLINVVCAIAERQRVQHPQIRDGEYDCEDARLDLAVDRQDGSP